MNVLITAAGRRNYLVRYFKDALGDSGRVYVADIDSDAPALADGDAVVSLPAARDPAFVETLLGESVRLGIGLVVPLNDLELQVMAANRSRLEENGVEVAVSDSDVVAVGLDKRLTAEFLGKIGLRSPKTYESQEDVEAALERGEVKLPLVVKPRWGSGSIAVEIVHSSEELSAAFALARGKISRSILRGLSGGSAGSEVLAQEFVAGQEYGLDVVNDLKGNYLTTFVRKKIGMRAGETDKAEIVDSPQLRELGESLGRALGHRGNLDVDVMVDEQGPAVIELNPRFGGGYPFSQEAGANLPLALVMWAKGQEAPPDALQVRIGSRLAKFELLMPLLERTSK